MKPKIIAKNMWSISQKDRFTAFGLHRDHPLACELMKNISAKIDQCLTPAETKSAVVPGPDPAPGLCNS